MGNGGEKTGNPLQRKDYRNVHLENTDLALGHRIWVEYNLLIIKSSVTKPLAGCLIGVQNEHFCEVFDLLKLAVVVICKYILAQANPL